MATALSATDSTRVEYGSLTLRAPAKLNLSLVVFGVGGDGFHGLHSVMSAIDLCDDLEIRVSKGEGIRLSCSGLSCPDGRENLVYRAAERFLQCTKLKLGVDISLLKRIPSGAGLGGASSDAAACLMGLNYLTGGRISRTELGTIAAELGSDVSFFLYGPTAVCTGRGERVERMAGVCSGSVLLILPGVHVSTAEVYRHYEYDESLVSQEMEAVSRSLAQGDLRALVGLGINSLVRPCMELHGQLRSLRDRIEGLGVGPLRLSGSGSTLFAVSTSAEVAEWAMKVDEHEEVDVKVVGFLSQQGYFPEVHHADNRDTD
ncbi:MAG: 4-(cytidine 5'-diphospho)-2-C-methyl-D-erythritol kinase [Sedimentisphaerales bacterium]|nr:4-(cytidine 5'-diphospho)-2-C-methyl-D-erythritol kinase [Sedimentisphaerales bacterium]